MLSVRALTLAAVAAASAARAADPPELAPARLYLEGRRAEAMAAVSGFSEQQKRRELGGLFQLRGVREPSAGALLRAALMLHTDRALAGRAPGAGAETPRACGLGDDDVLARSIAGYAVGRADAREFVRRWVVAMAARSQWDLCIDDVRLWTREGLKWFPREAQLSLLRALAAEASVRFDRAGSAAGSEPATSTHRRALVVRDLEEARDGYTAALASAPDLVPARIGLGRILWRQGSLDRALEELSRAARDAGDAESAYLARLFLARVLDDASRPADAERAYREALSALPDAQAAALGLAELLARNGEAAGSRAILERALATRGADAAADPYTFYHLGPAGRAEASIDALREEALG